MQMEMCTMAPGRMIREMDLVIISFTVIGVIEYYNGDQYNGEWKDNVKDGKGKCAEHL